MTGKRNSSKRAIYKYIQLLVSQAYCRLWEIENSVVGLHNSFTAGYIHTLMKQVKIKQQAFLPRPMSDLANSSSSMVPLQEILKRNSLEFGMQALHEVLRKWSQM